MPRARGNSSAQLESLVTVPSMAAKENPQPTSSVKVDTKSLKVLCEKHRPLLDLLAKE